MKLTVSNINTHSIMEYSNNCLLINLVSYITLKLEK